AVNGLSPTSSYMDFQENNDVRAQLIWDPTDATSIDYRYSRNNLETGAMWFRNFYRLESDPNQHYEFPINSYGNPTAIRTIDAHTVKIDQELELGRFTSISNLTDTDERYGVDRETRGHDRTGNVSFFTDVYVNEFLDGLSNPIDSSFFEDQFADISAGNFVGSDQYYDIKTFSQEFRFAGEVGDDFDYVVGAYLLLTDRMDTIRATWETPTGSSFDCEPAYVGGPPVSDLSCNGLIYSTENEQNNTAWAVFLSADYQLSENLILTAAARYDEDKRELTRIDGPTVDTFGLGVGDCDSISDPENCSPAGSKISRKFTAFQPKLSLAYNFNDQLTLYSTYARGFRSGGFNASGALLTDDYDGETIDSLELGLKSPLLKGRLRTNFAVFYQWYKNAQQFEFDGNVFVQSIYNIPRSEIAGFEANFDFVVTDALTVSAALGIMDSKITEFDSDIRDRMESALKDRNANTVKLPQGTQAAFDRNFHGSHLSSFAHTTVNIGLLHELSVFSNAMLITRLDYSYTDEIYWWLDEQDVRGSLALVDGSIALGLSEALEFKFWCKNCTDKIYDSEFSPNERELFNGAAKDIAYRARGRTYGFTLQYTY
ncbi:MAG: TonB-dependent receptor, partial [Pseudomonadales bacterium]